MSSRDIQKAYADLKVQAILFGMDVDVETMTLVPKSIYQEQSWITKWKERQDESDRQPEFNVDLA